MTNAETNEGNQDSQLYEWNDVAPAPNSGYYWHVLDEKGRPVKEQGRPLLITCRSSRSGFVGKRLRARWYCNALRSGSLSLHEHLETPLKKRWPVILYAIVGFLLFTGLWISKASGTRWDGPRDAVFWTTLAALVTMYVACISLVGVGVYMMMQLSEKLKITSLQYSCRGIAVLMGAGHMGRDIPWESLGSITQNSHFKMLRTRDGELYKIRTTPRSEAVLEAAVRVFLTRELERRREKVGQTTNRIGAFFAVGAGIIYVLSSRILPAESFEQSPIEHVILLLGLGAIVALGGAVYASIPNVGMRLAKWWYRQARRLARFWNRSALR